MSSNWKTLKIESSSIEIIDGDRGVNYPKQEEFFEDEHCLFLNTSNVTKQGFNFSKTQFITKAKDLSLRKGKLKQFDIVLTTRGTVGNIAYYNEDIPYKNIRINSGMVIFRNTDTNLISTKFFYQFLKSKLFHDQVISFSSGSAQPQLPICDLKQIEIPLPPLPTQERIAEILSTLDDKIELNSQTNATLEAIAQAIFKEWFVDFNYPGATGELIESELGLIPPTWYWGNLKNLCFMVNEKVNPLSVPADTAYVGLEHLPRKSLGLLSFGESGEVISQKNVFHKSDILFGRLRPYFHKVCIAPLDGVCSTDILVLRPNDNRLFSFCLNIIFSDTFISYASAKADGTRMPRINWDVLGQFLMPIPPLALIHEFSVKTIPMYDKLLQLNTESQTLSIVRDTLLARIMQ